MNRRTYWTCTTLRFNAGMDGRDEVDDIDKAMLVSSRLWAPPITDDADPVHPEDELHAPALDIDFPSELVPMKDKGRTEWRLHGLRLLNPGGLDRVGGSRPPSMTRGAFVDLCDRLALLGLSPRMRGSLRSLTLDPPTIIFKVPVVVVKSSTEGHCHLYIDHPVIWEEYSRLLLAMAGNILNVGFAQRSIERRMTMLLKPGLTKADLEAKGIVVEHSK